MRPGQLAAHPIALTMKFQLNSRAKPFAPMVKTINLVQHRRGNREEKQAPVSKHQTQFWRVIWASRRVVGEPNPPRKTKTSGANGGRNWRTPAYVKIIIIKSTVLAMNWRRRGRAGRRAARRQVRNDCDRARMRELIIATHSVWTMAVEGKHGAGRATVYRNLGVAVSLLFFKLGM